MSDNLMAVQKGVQVGCVDSLWGDANPTGRQCRGLDPPAVGGGNGARVGLRLHPTIVPHLAAPRHTSHRATEAECRRIHRAGTRQCSPLTCRCSSRTLTAAPRRTSWTV